MDDEIQIVASCLSLDERVPADVLAVTGASIATLLGDTLWSYGSGKSWVNRR